MKRKNNVGISIPMETVVRKMVGYGFFFKDWIYLTKDFLVRLLVFLNLNIILVCLFR